MRSFFKWLLILGLAMGLLALMAGGALWHQVASQPEVSISINGADLDLDDWQGLSWFGGVIGMLVAGAVLCIVLPLVLLFSLGLPILLALMVLGFVLLGVVGVGAMLGSPLIILGLLLWLVFRNKRPRSTRSANPPPPASIAR
jgi:prolipoprotein diacylglyceryltransferase